MQCPFCKANIDDDSFYCDQCGHEILVCPKCNKPGKGKVCIFDGIPLVSAKSKTVVSVSSDITSGLSSSVTQKDIKSAPVSEIGELYLINKTLGLDIKIEKDSLIGRTQGDFLSIFGKYNTVSGQHLKINFDPQKGWVVTDLNSTNGTRYNNTPLTPMKPQVLQDKSYLQIANIEFYVEIKKQTGKTGTVRI
jgi:hypothetical protein